MSGQQTFSTPLTGTAPTFKPKTTSMSELKQRIHYQDRRISTLQTENAALRHYITLLDYNRNLIANISSTPVTNLYYN